MNAMLVIGLNMRLDHQKCEYSYSNGYKSSARTGYVGNGYFSDNNGFGWGTTMRPSKLTLVANVDGVMTEVWIDHFFKDNWGRLTEKRVNSIRATMPQFVLLHEHTSFAGNRYYTLDENYAEAWLRCAKCYHESGVNRAKEIDFSIADAVEKLHGNE